MFCAATFSTHVWRLRDYYSRALLIEHVGGDTTLVIEQNGPVAALEGFRTDVLPGSATPPPREWGAYRTRLVTPMGIPITVPQTPAFLLTEHHWHPVPLGSQPLVLSLTCPCNCCAASPLEASRQTTDFKALSMPHFQLVSRVVHHN